MPGKKYNSSDDNNDDKQHNDNEYVPTVYNCIVCLDTERVKEGKTEIVCPYCMPMLG
jgi:hypothetical protein